MNHEKLRLIGLGALLLLSLGCGGGGGSNQGNPTTPVAVSISPTATTIAPSGTKTFVATVTGTENTAVTWTATSGTVTSAGLYTAPTTTGAYTVRATSVADTTKYAEAKVTVASPGDIRVTVSPATTTLGLGQSKSFKATVTGTEDTSVTWEASAGRITTTGFFTAPTTAGIYTITARSTVNPAASGTATVTVSGSGLTVIVTPQNATLGTRESAAFTATVTNATNKSVTWTATGGTIDSSGSFTAPDTAGTYTVTATSVEDPTKSASVSVKVNQVAVSVSPDGITLVTGTQAAYRATVTGAKNSSVTWQTNGGSITSAGVYTAPSTAGTYTIRATSVVDSRATAAVSVIVVEPSGFFYDFQSGVPAAWTPTTWDTAPGGQKFLGRLAGTNSATLTLSGLTSHTKLRISFDLYVIGDWENEKLGVSLGGTSFFSQGFSNVKDITQTYPDGGTNAPGTGRITADSLGYPFAGTILYKDTTYHITQTIDHTATTAQFLFSAALTRTLADQSWGLDNVRVEALP
ncbi:hypothetical protein [Fimbriimonas ginsengisoli]|uniref:Ig domain protein, group 2 domain protein n=1 Tax=Fimbriimonas ginsengisoli Gsoil 348 TaxID=661478 RepID=A0A068NRS3_FIMGI|nr:hypothetical protein [Fimbriimonas ginsengisoli]AIE84319.1 Ig domain protein, group 2 domain protein [Fimbriimonas ginsengisoli Gsoil 348]